MTQQPYWANAASLHDHTQTHHTR